MEPYLCNVAKTVCKNKVIDLIKPNSKYLFDHDELARVFCGDSKLEQIILSEMCEEQFLFQKACLAGDEDSVLYLLPYVTDANCSSPIGNAMNIAVTHGYASIVDILLQSNASIQDPADFDSIELKNCKCFFYLSTLNGWTVILQLLVDHKKDIFKKAKHCVNVLKFACFGGHSVILSFCLEKLYDLVLEKAILEEFIQSGTLLDICLHNNHSSLVSVIVDKGAKITKHIISKHDKSLINYLYSGIKKEAYIDWRYKSLQDISINWIIPSYENVLELDLSFNEINILMPEVPWRLKNLKKFVIKHSSLFGLASPKEFNICCTSLEYVDVSNNELMYLPSEFFLLPNLKIINAENNHIQILSAQNLEWKCNELKQLIVGGNDIIDFPIQINCCFGLKKISFKKNRLTHFVRPWNCLLRILDLSHNSIETFLDPDSEFCWNKSLKEVYISNNLITEVPNFVLRLEVLEVLNLSNNLLKSFPHPHDWFSKCLKILNLSHNNLGHSRTNKHQLELGKVSDAQCFKQRNFNLESGTSFELPFTFSNVLTELYLNDNDLKFVPLSVTCMKKLTKLDLSCNKGLEEIPFELTELYYLEHLVIDRNNFKDSNLNLLVNKGCSTKELLAYLRQKCRKFTTFNRLRCFILGKKSAGKLSLIKSLGNNQVISDESKFNVLELHWDCSSSKLRSFFSKSFPENQILNLQLTVVPDNSSIDFKPLYSQGCLYLVVFDLRLLKNLEEHLCSKLCDLQAEMPNAHVIVVGTFLDCLSEGRDILINVKSSIIKKYSAKLGFPRIIDIIFVSNIKNKEGISLLKTAIINAYYKFNLGVVLDHNQSDPKQCRMFPKDYLEISKEILQEKNARKHNGVCPLLNENEFEELLKKVKHAGNMLNTKEDKELVEKFLKAAGYVINLPKGFGKLSNWYFIDIQWLGNILMDEANFEDCCNFINGATISTNNVKNIFDLQISSKLCKTFSPDEEIQLLEAFGILHKLFDDGYLISQKIPIECLDLNIEPYQINSRTFFRFYKMKVTPGGFFKNLLVRLIGLFQASKLGLDINNLRSTFKQFSLFTHISYWQKGFILETDVGYLRVEVVSNLDFIYNLASDGLVVYALGKEGQDCQTEIQNIFCSAIDLTNDLIEQNYPGLFDDGCMQVLTTCPYHPEAKSDLNLIELFECLKVILASKSASDLFISCPSKQCCKIPLTSLVPDLLLCDLPLRFCLDINQVSSQTEKDVLGQGGEGIVYRSKLKDFAVAVKQNEIMVSERIKSLTNAPHDVEDEEFLKQKVSSAFRNYRHETSMLAKLKHPCIVSLLGFCATTLTYVMELSPIGSLRSVLDTDFNKITFYDKYKICSQIISALKYLHNQKLVYKDMKPENILVWSLHKNELVSVKLSDYGLIKRLFASGIKGIEGTLGYQAPEILLNRSYDEKVDIFAFSMVAYELYTGDKSFLEHSSATINKNIKQGNRPATATDLKLFPKICSFITRCWDQEPDKRPNAEELDQMMRDLSFMMLEEVVFFKRCGIIGVLSSACIDQNRKNLIHMWSGTNSGRCYHLYDHQEHEFDIVNCCLPGASIICSSQLGTSFLVLGTEACSLEIIEFSCGNRKVRKITTMSTTSLPRCIATMSDANSDNFLIGFQDGELILYEFCALDIQLICSIRLTTSPINNLNLISSSVWATCGSEIHINELSQASLKTKLLIKLKNNQSGVTLTDLCHHGDQVWCAYEPTGIIVEIDLETLDVICIFDCKNASQDVNVSSFSCQEIIKTETFGEESYSSPIIFKSGDEATSPKYLRSRQKRSVRKNIRGQILRSYIESTLSSQIRSISYVNGILWVVLKNCKVILINVTRENMFNYDYGQVLNIMTGHGNKDEMTTADIIIKVEDAAQPKTIIAKVYQDKALPYKTVQLESWIGLDLATTHSYMMLHKQLQDITDSTN